MHVRDRFPLRLCLLMAMDPRVWELSVPGRFDGFVFVLGVAVRNEESGCCRFDLKKK